MLIPKNAFLTFDAFGHTESFQIMMAVVLKPLSSQKTKMLYRRVTIAIFISALGLVLATCSKTKPDLTLEECESLRQQFYVSQLRSASGIILPLTGSEQQQLDQCYLDYPDELRP